MKIITKKLEFISICIEHYKMKYHMGGKEVENLFAKYHVINFLLDNYDVLHTQSLDYVLEEIELFLEKRRISR